MSHEVNEGLRDTVQSIYDYGRHDGENGFGGESHWLDEITKDLQSHYQPIPKPLDGVGEETLRQQLRHIVTRGGMSGRIPEILEVELDDLEQLFTAHAEQYAAERGIMAQYFACSWIMNTMAPLMVHRLEKDFPSMTGEVIGNVYEEVKKLMKPYQDMRQAQLTNPSDKDKTT